MADLIGVDDFLNVSAPFSPEEYIVKYKMERNYSDFSFNNVYKDSCEYPRFWNLSGELVLASSTEKVDLEFGRLVGCFDSEFDQVSYAGTPGLRNSLDFTR